MIPVTIVKKQTRNCSYTQAECDESTCSRLRKWGYTEEQIMKLVEEIDCEYSPAKPRTRSVISKITDFLVRNF